MLASLGVLTAQATTAASWEPASISILSRTHSNSHIYIGRISRNFNNKKRKYIYIFQCIKIIQTSILLYSSFSLCVKEDEQAKFSISATDCVRNSIKGWKCVSASPAECHLVNCYKRYLLKRAAQSPFLQQQRILSEAQKITTWLFWTFTKFSHYISVCIKAGSAKRKAKPILWTDVIKPSISLGFFCSYGHNDISLLCLFSSGEQWQFFTSAHTFLYSFPPACTSWHIKSHLHFNGTQNNICLKSLSSLFSSTFPAVEDNIKTRIEKVERGEREISGTSKHCRGAMNFQYGSHTVQAITLCQVQQTLCHTQSWPAKVLQLVCLPHGKEDVSLAPTDTQAAAPATAWCSQHPPLHGPRPAPKAPTNPCKSLRFSESISMPVKWH